MTAFSRVGSFASLCLLLVLGGCSGSSPSGSSPAPAPSPAPAAVLSITSVAPTKVSAGSSAFTLTVTGTGFASTTQLRVGGTAVAANYISSSQMTAGVPANAINNGAQLSVVAANGSVTSATDASAVKLEVDNPVPQLTSFSPLALVAGSGSSIVSVTGSGFVPSTVIQVNGSSRPTAFVSGTQVNFIVADADLATGGALALMAFNPPPAGGISGTASVPVSFPAPGGITLAPSAVQAATTRPTTVTVTGTNFVAGSVAQVNGNARPTTVVSSTQLTFALTVDDQANQGTLNVTVANPQPGGGVSAAAVLTLTAPPPSPSISGTYPANLMLGTPTTLYVSGGDLDQSAIINWNGKPLQTFWNAPYSYGTPPAFLTPNPYLTAFITADLLSAAGTATITVSSPNAPQVSNAVSVLIVNPPVPTLTFMYPAASGLNTSTKVTISGSGLTPATIAQLDGTPLATSFQDDHTISAVVPAASVSLPGAHSVTLSTPAPGGGTSGSLPFTAYVALPNTAMALNPANGLLYVSVPSSAGVPYGNAVVSVDPATGTIGKPIPVGSEPGKLAISSDGTTAWVALDGASAIRKIDLTTGTAGLQFSLSNISATNGTSAVVQAITVLPGATTSIAVEISSSYYGSQSSLLLFDNGVARSNQATVANYGAAIGIFASPTKPEIYVFGLSTGYQVLKYDASGLSQTASNTNLNTSYSYGVGVGAVQVDGGKAYLSSGQVVDPETGNLLGTFYLDKNTVATGPMVSDSGLGKAFILLNNPVGGTAVNSNTSIQAFDEANQTLIASASIPVSGVIAGPEFGSNSGATSPGSTTYVDTLVRWGTNGLAFRGFNGIVSLRSNIVSDLSSTSADLQVAVRSPSSAVTGSAFTETVTVTNSGPSSASNVALTELVPSNTDLVSAVSTQGSCGSGTLFSCDLGSLAKGASATLTLSLKGNNSGDATFSPAVSAGENDPNTSNNTASSSTMLTGGAMAATPLVGSVSPNAALVGSQDTVLTVTGSGFTSASTVTWAGTALGTTLVNSTKLTATVPAASLANFGWAPITVTTPAPGGGTSNPVPFTVFNTIKLQANHMAVEPFTGRLYATVNSSATETTGNSLVVIDPLTGGLGTPVSIGSQPGAMAFSDDGKILYVAQTGAQSVGRFNVGTQTLEFSFPISIQQFGGSSPAAADTLAVLPGTENTVGIDFSNNSSAALYDVDPVAQTASTRVDANGQNTNGFYAGVGFRFLNDTSAFAVSNGSAGVVSWSVTPSGFTSGFNQSYTLNSFGLFQLQDGVAYANPGGVVDLTVTPPAPRGVFLQSFGNPVTPSFPSSGQITAPDTSLRRSFFALSPTWDTAGKTAIIMTAFDQRSFLQTDAISLPYTFNPSSYQYGFYNSSNVDFVRWGQDGLAVLLSDGQVVLLRGAFVVPALMTNNHVATLGSISRTTIAHGSGNVVLNVTGTNFVPGAGVLWNGAYRTTKFLDPSHLTFDVPASDVVGVGSADVTVVNPNVAASNAITVTIH